MLITIEGLDGCGKTTVARMLARATGFAYICTPGYPYENIREDAAKDIFSAFHFYISSCYNASRLSERGDFICDRYIHSTVAYNWPYKEPAPSDIYALFPGLARPDRAFLLLAPDETRRQRINLRRSAGGKFNLADADIAAQKLAASRYERFTDLIPVNAYESAERVCESIRRYLAGK